MSAPPALKVYWQPGCTSCLKAKEFLAAHGIPFESINVREDPAAQAALAALGVRTVPVVARGRDYVLAQDIDELARFAGVTLERQRLPADELVARIDALLAAACTIIAALPAERLRELQPGRDRYWLDLGFHLGMIVVGAVEALEGGELTYEHFERRAPASWGDAAPAVEFLHGAQRALAIAWQSAGGDAARPARTYYGTVTAAQLLERTAWHVAEHCQLEAVAGIVALPAGVLAGLPGAQRQVLD